MIWIQILLSVVGIAAVLWGADKFTDGAGSLAARLKVPQMVIGLTVVAFGTSAPEFFISLVSALQDKSGMAIGNVVGSNIFNVLLIVGMSAALCSIQISRSTIRKDLPWTIASTLLFTFLCLDGCLSRLDGVVLTAVFGVFLFYTFRWARDGDADQAETPKINGVGRSVMWLLVGLTALIVGSQVFVHGASAIARALGVSDLVVGLTIVAGGTSLPELATSVISARKGQSALALGNVIGSNVFNILMILGITAWVTPLSLAGVTWVDYGTLLLSVLLLWWMSYTQLRVTRKEGVVLLLFFAAYLYWLIHQALAAAV